MVVGKADVIVGATGGRHPQWRAPREEDPGSSVVTYAADGQKDQQILHNSMSHYVANSCDNLLVFLPSAALAWCTLLARLADNKKSCVHPEFDAT